MPIQAASRRIARAAAAGTLAATLVGCDTGDAVVEITADHPILNFPTALGDPSALPGGSVSVSTTGGALQITVRFARLLPLSTGTYKAFLVKRATGTARAAAGTHTVTGGAGSPVEAAFNTPSYTAEHTLVINATTAGADPRTFDRFVISLESDAGAASPTNPFLAFDYLDDRGTPDPADDRITTSGPLVLGRVVAAGALERFAPAGSGRGQIFRDSLIVSLRRIAAPPAGWVYKAFLVDRNRQGIQKETLVGPVTLDTNGDVDLRIASADVGGLATYNTFVLSLHPSIGDAGKVTPLIIHISDDYRTKYAEFFGLTGR